MKIKNLFIICIVKDRNEIMLGIIDGSPLRWRWKIEGEKWGTPPLQVHLLWIGLK